MKNRILKLLFSALALGLISPAFAADDSRLLRYPDINNDLVAFVYAGDIWTVSAEGGDARHLTSHEGMELFPKISPDGKWIAYSAEYSGSRQVYIIPAEGGVPRQLTYYNSVGLMPPRGGFDDVVLDWTSDSQHILIRANRTPFGERPGKYFLVNIDGGLEQPLPPVNGGFACLSPDDSKLCFTPVDREFRSWKRYKGGRATELWVYDLKANSSEQITNFAGSDQWPVWFQDKIYFTSDRDLRLNVYSYDTTTKELKQITEFKDFDVMWPSGQNGQMVYENGGYLYKTDLRSGQTEKLTVNIKFDNPNLLPYFKNVKDDIHSFAVSPSAKRALFDARGDIFSVPAENGVIENLTNTQGVREIYPSWSPNGKYMAYYSDANGEYEIYLLENKKGAKPRQLTKNSSAWKYDHEWSPDSKYLLYFDRTLQLKLTDVATGKETVVDKATFNEIHSYSFSPDSKWVVYSKESSNSQPSVWVYNLESNKNIQLTDDTFNDYSPVFSADGKYIYFLSNRDFNLDFSDFEFSYIYNNATRIYAMVLDAAGEKLFPFKNDLETVKKEEANSKKDESQADKRPGVTVKIDVDGINDRIVALPLPNAAYRNLMAIDGGVAYLKKNKLYQFKLEDKEEKEVLGGVTQATLASDRQSFLYRSGANYGVAKMAPGQADGSGQLDFSNLEMKIDPKKEWEQIYMDGWRIFRDYFYVANLHGVDWDGLRENYGKLVPYVGHRADLDYIFSEIIAETNTGHSYANWGDFKKPKRVEGGLLGAELEADPKVGRYKITRIYKGQNWNQSLRSPLTEQGVDVKVGDYLLTINGKELTTDENPYLLLENTADKYIELEVSASGKLADARSSMVMPIESETDLRHFNWVQERREMVDRLSGGRIGYIYVPNTAYEGNRELFKGMYAYHDKEALIIDDRYNGGGFIPNVMTDLLDRKTMSYWQVRGLEPMKTPEVAHNGPKAMLINGYSSSGGDAFPYYFKQRGLGPLIGTRTWGGLVGISGNASFVDGGSINVPRFGVYNEDSQWIVEGVGVYPDIEVVDRPEQIAKGIDPSIEKAVEVLLKELKEHPVKKVKSPTPPDRSGWIEQDIK